MPSGWQQLAPRDVVSFDDVVGQSTLSTSGDMTDSGLTVVLTYRTKPGLKAFLTSLRQAWDPGLDPYIRYSLRINGAIVANYNQLQAQIAAPEQDVDLPVPITLDQNALVEFVAYATSSATFPGIITARMIFKYLNP